MVAPPGRSPPRARPPPHTVRAPDNPTGQVSGAPPIAPAVGIDPFDDAGEPVSGPPTDWVGLPDAGTEPNQEPGAGAD